MLFRSVSQSRYEVAHMELTPFTFHGVFDKHVMQFNSLINKPIDYLRNKLDVMWEMLYLNNILTDFVLMWNTGHGDWVIMDKDIAYSKSEMLSRLGIVRDWLQYHISTVECGRGDEVALHDLTETG